ncbi:hypothetical protein [Kordia sp.]|uniref:hypothetical protein n=1 Tax=Kordia sp. TaxID=1965332 RepID=UPI003B596186
MNSNTISDKELIEKFLRDELREEEKRIFDTRKKDEAFMILLEEAVISYKGRLTLKQNLQNISENVNSKTKKNNRNSNVWISRIAASLVLFFSIYFLLNKQSSSEELFSNYFEPYPNIYTQKGGFEAESLSKKAFNFYDATQYKLAIETFNKIASERALRSPEHFYFGISLLSTQKPEAAKVQFKKVAVVHPFYNESQWYIALALIKQDSLSKAKTLLNNSKSKFSTTRKKEVQNLLDQLP